MSKGVEILLLMYSLFLRIFHIIRVISFSTVCRTVNYRQIAIRYLGIFFHSIWKLLDWITSERFLHWWNKLKSIIHHIKLGTEYFPANLLENEERAFNSIHMWMYLLFVLNIHPKDFRKENKKKATLVHKRDVCQNVQRR